MFSFQPKHRCSGPINAHVLQYMHVALFFPLVYFVCCLAQERLPWSPCCQQLQTGTSPQWECTFPANIYSWLCPGGMELLLSVEVREVSFWLSSEKQDVKCSSGDGWKRVLMLFWFFLWLKLFNVSVLSSEAEGPGLGVTLSPWSW